MTEGLVLKAGTQYLKGRDVGRMLHRVHIENLYGMFTHQFRLNADQNLTIITAPNGFGKTVVLRLIYAVCSGSFIEFYRVSFDFLSLYFTDGTVISIVRKEGQPSLFEDTASSSTGDDRPGSQGYREPDWLREFRSTLSCRFIETQRLLRIPVSEEALARRRLRDGEMHFTQVVTELADDLSSNIKSKLTEYAALSQSLDSTFPHRLIASVESPALSQTELRQKLQALDAERSRLMEAGLLGRETALQLPQETIPQAVLNVLSIYVTDTEKKLSIFKDLYQKIDILRSMINKKYTYKNLYVDRDKGMGVRLSNGTELPLEGLSSGEQHELVLLYELLFKVRPGSLILIDEPELSLHIAWQKQFISDLASVAAVSGFQAIVATHSPQIINDRWDLAVTLEGPPAGASSA